MLNNVMVTFNFINVWGPYVNRVSFTSKCFLCALFEFQELFAHLKFSLANIYCVHDVLKRIMETTQILMDREHVSRKLISKKGVSVIGVRIIFNFVFGYDQLHFNSGVSSINKCPQLLYFSFLTRKPASHNRLAQFKTSCQERDSQKKGWPASCLEPGFSAL